MSGHRKLILGRTYFLGIGRRLVPRIAADLRVRSGPVRRIRESVAFERSHTGFLSIN